MAADFKKIKLTNLILIHTRILFQISGCNFHWNRNLDNNITAKHLTGLREASPAFAHQIKLLKSLAYVPPEDVPQAFKELATKIAVKLDDFTLVDAEAPDKIKAFLKYMQM